VTYLRSKGRPILEIENISLDESQAALLAALLDFWSHRR
jgi:hypothetical protein